MIPFGPVPFMGNITLIKRDRGGGLFVWGPLIKLLKLASVKRSKFSSRAFLSFFHENIPLPFLGQKLLKVFLIAPYNNCLIFFSSAHELSFIADKI